MPRRPTEKLTPAVKAKILAAVASGVTYADTAAMYSVSQTRVRAMVKDFEGSAPIEKVNKEEENVSVQTQMMDLLHVMLTTLKEQADFATNKEWLAKQQANDLAIFFGVLSDKAFRNIDLLIRLEQLRAGGEKKAPE